MNYDLAVAYRIYPGMAKSVAIFPDNKLKFAEFCLSSFKQSLGSLKVKMWVLLDNCPPEYDDLFLKYFDTADLELIHLEKAGNSATFGRQIQILSEQNDAEFVYFAEDDYYFIPNQFENLIEFMKSSSDVHFITAYDHPDYYTLDFHRHTFETRENKDYKWRTVATTTCSFLTTKTVLLQTKNVFNTYYVNKNYDTSIWQALTKYNVLNPYRIVKYLFMKYPTSMNYFKIIARAWKHCWKQILFGKRWKLWVPSPSIATHMEKEYLAPGVDWQQIFDSTSENF
jgi:hypothetical protein